MKNLSKTILAAFIILPLLNSCGKSSSGSGTQKEEAPEEGSLDGSTIEGKYVARFETLNPHVNGTIPGSLTMFRDKDRLMVYLRLFAGKPKAWHQQGIYKGRRCPNLGDDRNGDGFVDIDETMAVVGKVIIPLDTNLNSQASGKNFYPVGDLSGYYHYERVASFSRMFSDLKEEDKDPEDHIIKLAPEEKFSFEGRVVIVQGVTEDTILPDSVVGLGHRRNFQSLPIVCGVIKKDNTNPGTPDHGEIPGPVAEVEEGQDRPAPPEEGETETSGGTVSGTTGTNDTNDGEVGDEGGTGGGTTTGGTTGGTTGRSTGGRTAGGFIGGFIGGSSGGRTGGTSGGESTGGTSTGGSTTGGTTGRTIGGFIGGFIGGSSGGSTTGGSTSGRTGGSTTGGTTGE